MTFLGVGCKNRTWGLIFVLAIFVGFRYGVGWDYWNYTRAIQEAGYGLDRFEWLPRQLGYIAHELSFVQLYFIVVAFFSMLFVIKALKRMSENFSVSLYIFLTFPLFFLFSLVIDRFFLALAIMFYGSTFLFKGRKIIPFIICLLIAFNIHKASLVSILFLIPYYIRVGQKMNLFLFVFASMVTSFISLYIVELVVVLGGISGIMEDGLNSFVKYAEQAYSSDMNKIPYLFYVINIINLLFRKNLFRDNESIDTYLTIFNIGCCLMLLFSFEQNMSSRFSTFFLLYLCFIAPYYKYPKIVKPICYSLGFLLFIYALTVKASHVDFVGRRNCYLPYSTFIFN